MGSQGKAGMRKGSLALPMGGVWGCSGDERGVWMDAMPMERGHYSPMKHIRLRGTLSSMPILDTPV